MPHPRAGTPAQPEDLIDVASVLEAYHSRTPDLSDPGQRVVFGTSGHRGSSLDGAFTDAHIAATTQAIVDYRRGASITGPLFIGRDSHALSEPAMQTAIEVLVANDVAVLADSPGSLTPTPAVSRAILAHNRESNDRADGIVVTPSHNPPRDGGFKYNPPTGGPADSDITGQIADAANAYLENGMQGVRRVDADTAAAAVQHWDFRQSYVDDLSGVIDFDAVRSAGIRIGVDPLGGAAVDYWAAIAKRYSLSGLTVVNPAVDPTFEFMTLDKDGKIRMDCSSPDAMASLVAMRDSYDIAVGNDADADRHGIVTPDGGLMNPNHFLAVAIDYLLTHRPQWGSGVAVGKTLVSSSMIDRVVAGHGRRLVEVPVGFKWFVPGLLDGTVCFGGEESAGATLLRTDGTVWTTDKDGIVMALLAAEILAVTGKSPSQRYRELTEQYGAPVYARVDAPANREQKALLAKLTADQVQASSIAGEPVTSILTSAPGNDAAIGGIKVCTDNAWFAARPSGTEDVYKIYAESFVGAEHLAQVQREAAQLVDGVLAEG